MSPILEEYDPVTGFIGSVGEVRESIEVDINAWTDEDSMRSMRWRGYVEWPESGERSSIKREADWGRAAKDVGVPRKGDEEGMKRKRLGGFQ